MRLEQNYRSSGNILAAANSLIANNQGRLGKNLWTKDGDGEPVSIYAAFNDIDEAQFVATRIQQWVEEGGRREEIAILYRVSAQSRVLEEALLTHRIPYRVYGGLRFYERAEIKNALAYCRLAVNRSNDVAFERVVNMPPRRIGARTVDLLRTEATGKGTSLWLAALWVIDEGMADARATGALQKFVDLIEELTRGLQELSLEEQVKMAVESSSLLEYYRAEKIDRAQTRIENLEELVAAAGQFEREESGNHHEPMSAFLSRAALQAGEEQADGGDDQVSLMTLHSAKGLEFPVVFLCGMEEGLFPHSRSSDDPQKLEEERRLCYVGMTRAKRRLCMTYAESRRLYGGSGRYSTPSRFLRELPPERVEEVRLRGTVVRPGLPRRSDPRAASGSVRNAPDELRLGQRVQHPKFGEGVVLMYEGQGRHARVQVNFERAGSKWLVVDYANLVSSPTRA